MIYIPYPDFQSSARCLDSELLGKMRWEVQGCLFNCLLIRAFDGGTEQFRNWKTWNGYEFALCSFGFELCREWILRGNVDTIQVSLMDLSQLIKCSLPPEPKWLFSEERMIRERQELSKRNPSWYCRFWNPGGILNA